MLMYKITDNAGNIIAIVDYRTDAITIANSVPCWKVGIIEMDETTHESYFGKGA